MSQFMQGAQMMSLLPWGVTPHKHVHPYLLHPPPGDLQQFPIGHISYMRFHETTLCCDCTIRCLEEHQTKIRTSMHRKTTHIVVRCLALQLRSARIGLPNDQLDHHSVTFHRSLHSILRILTNFGRSIRRRAQHQSRSFHVLHLQSKQRSRLRHNTIGMSVMEIGLPCWASRHGIV